MMDTMIDDDNNDNSSHLIGLRNRKSTTATTRAKSSIPSTISFDANATATADNVTTNTNTKIRTFSVLWKFICILLHGFSVICFMGGFLLRKHLQFNSGTEECEMTFSMRIFLPVEVTATIAADHDSLSSSSSNNEYQLYKFIDRRDPRYLKFIQRKKEDLPTTDNPLRRQDRHCRSSDNIVVYVPGHWGSYDQARSLGAHGIQLTKANDPTVLAIKKLLESKQQFHPETDTQQDIKNINAFIYDVYALDFQEQGSAFHGQFLMDQSNYLANVVTTLSMDCDSSSSSSSSQGLTIVGHSMGGIVIRLMLQNNPQFMGELGLIQNVITLATPHSNPLYAFDKSIDDIYQQLLVPLQPQKLQSRSPPQHSPPFLLSISGGLRDEMIDPSACRVTVVVATADLEDIQQQQQQNDRSVPVVSREERFLSREARSSTSSSWSLLVSSSPLLSALSYLGTSVWSSFCTTSSNVRVKEAPNSITILSTELMMHNTNNPNHNLVKKKQKLLRLGMDHRAIVWCHQLLNNVRRILYDVIIVTATNNNNSLQDQGFDSYSQQLQLLYVTYHEKYHWCILICMESSQLYHLPYLLGLYTVLTMFLLTIQNAGTSTTRNRSTTSRIIPVLTTILLGGLVRCTTTNDITTGSNKGMLLITTIILGFVANSINFILIQIISFLIQRRLQRLHYDKNDTTESANSSSSSSSSSNNIKSYRSPLPKLWKALRRSFMVVFILGMMCTHFYYHNSIGVGDDNDNSSLLNDHFPFYLDLILYVYSIISIYITLWVWLCCFINNNNYNNNNKNNSNTNNNTSHSFVLVDIQLIVFLTLLVIPISVCGPLVLMVWEKNVRASSWHTLFSIQIPILILSILKIHLLHTNTTTTTNDDPKRKNDNENGNGNDNDNDNDKKKKAVTATKKQQQHLIKTIRSSFVHILIYAFYHPLLSQGTGYLIPYVAQYLLWIDIVTTTTIITVQHYYLYHRR